LGHDFRLSPDAPLHQSDIRKEELMIGDPVDYTMKTLASRRRTDLPAGWRPIFDRLVDGLSSLPRMPGLVTVAVRQGHLHVQLALPDRAAQSMIDQAVGECSRTCDVCGIDGTLHGAADGWVVRCRFHRPQDERLP
jgi:hypothetical protein